MAGRATASRAEDTSRTGSLSGNSTSAESNTLPGPDLLFVGIREVVKENLESMRYQRSNSLCKVKVKGKVETDQSEDVSSNYENHKARVLNGFPAHAAIGIGFTCRIVYRFNGLS